MALPKGKKKKKVLCQIMLLLKINPRISTHDSVILFGRVFKTMICYCAHC